jgi:paraquat-inducible protein B
MLPIMTVISFGQAQTDTMLYGGIAFETPKNFGSIERAEPGHVFTLYESRNDSRESKYKKKDYYVAYFDRSVAGLQPGAPVEFRGMKIGEVSEMKLEFQTHNHQFRIPILIEIEPERISIVGEAIKMREGFWMILSPEAFELS